MNAITTDIQPTKISKKRVTKDNNMVNLFQKKMSDFKLEKAWHKRNVEHGDVLISSLELEVKPFFQQYYVEETADLVKKLTRIGFSELKEYPEHDKFGKFSKVMYHKKFNISLNLYNSANKHAILTAIEIVEKSIIDHDTAMVVLFSAIDVLMDNKNG